MENMEIYNRVRACPNDALKPITAGKLKGKSDINPMWRIKTLTETFGMCGVGWRTSEEQFWTTPGANGEVIAWCSLKLICRDPDSKEWNEPVFGIGGSMLVDTHRDKLTSNDDAYKMAYTDAISVACKSLGFAADVYWGNDATKYSNMCENTTTQKECLCEDCGQTIIGIKVQGQVFSTPEIVSKSKEKYGAKLCWMCMKTRKKMDEDVKNNA